VRELDALLRQVQGQELVATARAVATALHDRPRLLLSGEPYPVPASSGGDVRVPNLERPITLDGLGGDWDQPEVEVRPGGASVTAEESPYAFRYSLGRFGSAVFLLVVVQDLHVVTRDKDRPQAACDQVVVAVVTPDDELLRFAIDAQGDGPVSTWLLRDDGTRVPDSRITGVWRTAPDGYLVELRLPRSLIGPRLSLGVVDVDDPASRAVVGRLGHAETGSREELDTVLVPSPEVSELVRGLGRGQSRIWVVDRGRRVLAHAGSLHRPAASAASRWDRLAQASLRALTARLLGEPREDFADLEPGTFRLGWPTVERALAGQEATGERLTADGRAVVLSAAQPIWVEDQVRGAVLVEETTNDILALRNRAFERLFAAILGLTAFGAAGLVLLASRLSWRIRRLRDELERAIDAQGRVSGGVGGAGAADEVGDLARSISSILERQRQYTAYLEQVGQRLSHEIRTPVGVVRSSLDNLRLQPLPEEARVYIERADVGLRRLATMLARLGEAARLEQALAATDREVFDAVAVVRGCVEGYRAASPGRLLELRLPPAAVPVSGAPDLLAQMLDKLVDNALSFALPGTEVVVALVRHGHAAALSVSNQGPRLPEAMAGRLFESMVSIRPAGSGGSGGEPHLGLGLYIVRLIAAFHGGSAAAHDRPDGDGVIVTVWLPLAVTVP